MHVMAQDIAIGQWRDHLAYNQGTSVVAADKMVYCIANGNVFSYNTEDNNIVRLNKVNGFSDINAVKVAYNKTTKAVVIAYNNTNIDIIKDGKIINVSDIKNKQVFGNKTINNIYMEGNLAYISCGFGVVVLDLNKIEMKDTYSIGNTGVVSDIKDFSSNDT